MKNLKIYVIFSAGHLWVVKNRGSLKDAMKSASLKEKEWFTSYDFECHDDFLIKNYESNSTIIN